MALLGLLAIDPQTSGRDSDEQCEEDVGSPGVGVSLFVFATAAFVDSQERVTDLPRMYGADMTSVLSCSSIAEGSEDRGLAIFISSTCNVVEIGAGRRR